MGIKGLNKLLQTYAEGSYKEGPIKSYFGRSIAIDATMALYQFLIAIRHGAYGQTLTNDDGEPTSHINGFFYRTIRMMENGIKPVYVFDGKPPDFKADELKKRKERREKAQAELKEAEELDDKEKIIQMQKRTVKVTKQHVKDVQLLLSLMGVPWIAAPGEAEAQAAIMCAEGLVYGCGTEDMDALTFGTSKLVRHLTYSEARKTPVLEYNLPQILNNLNINMNQFVDMCILCGCDYVPSIRGIGPVKAYEYIKKYKNIETIIDNIKNTKYIVPDNWQYKHARELFKNPNVLRKKDIPKLIWGNMKENELTKYLVDRMGFNSVRITNAINRLKKCKGKSSQKRLDSFFKLKPSPARNNNNNKNKNKKNKNKNKKKISGRKRKRPNDDNMNNNNKIKKQRTKK